MAWNTITKSLGSSGVPPNLSDYEESRRTFSWQAAESELDWLPGGKGLNIAYEAVDRHAVGNKRDHLAIRWLGKSGAVREFTYHQLAGLTNKFANVLKGLGVSKGDRVYALTGRVPEFFVAAFGTMKNGSVFCPLFSAFGPEPIKSRVSIGEPKVLVTTDLLYERKVKNILPEMESVKHVIVVGGGQLAGPPPQVTDYGSLMAAASEEFTIDPTNPDDIALLHFTSGTTGKPKGALHAHRAVVAHQITGRLALDFHEQDIFWCTADPGWVTGTSYGLISPLTNGITSIVDESDFDAQRWYQILQDQKVTVWYTAPTAIRMMMKGGVKLLKSYDLSSLRFLSSVGEPLNPEAVVWGVEAFGLPFHDNWWQTETGGIMVANFASMDVKPGSMGRPLPGVEAAIVRKSESGQIEVISEPDVQGELALRPGWPSMFRAYMHEPVRYEKCFAGGFYLTGDLAKQDSDGYFWFVGRKDDVIKTSGHLIGPFEVESILMEHKAVAEAGVIGKPDPVAGEIIKAFVMLKDGYEPSDQVRRDLLAFGRVRLGAAIAPKEIAFTKILPRTRSGKIMRRLLKARELGLPEGDISTLEEGSS